MNILRGIILAISSFLMSFAIVPTYTEGVIGQPKTFLPGMAQTQHDKTVSSLIYRGLFTYDIYGSIVPDLADTWEISEDGLVYTIKLKANQKWSDGSTIDADDLIYTSFNVPDLAGIATDKVDDLTVRYTLPNKFSPFLNLLTVGIMPSNILASKNYLKPVSNGDWSVVRIEKNGNVIRQVTLRTTSEKYQIKRISFRYYSNEDELVTASKLGEIDAFISGNDHTFENFNDYKFPVQSVSYDIFFNLRSPKLKDLAFRQKLGKVLDLKDIIFDRGIDVQGPISRSVFTDKGLKFDLFDPKYAGEDLVSEKLFITYIDKPENNEFVDRIKKIWKDKLGLDVDGRPVSKADMEDKILPQRDFEILFYGQEVSRDPDRYVYWHSTQKDSPLLNISGFEQVRADRALEEGRKELDQDKRFVHYNEFQKSVMENTPALFLYHPFTHFYVSKYIEGVGEKYTFTPSDRFLDLYNWKRLETN